MADFIRQGRLFRDIGFNSIGLIGLTARYALDVGFHVVVEGNLYPDHYGDDDVNETQPRDWYRARDLLPGGYASPDLLLPPDERPSRCTRPPRTQLLAVAPHRARWPQSPLEEVELKRKGRAENGGRPVERAQRVPPRGRRRRPLRCAARRW